MEPQASQPQLFYRWMDPQGRIHVVSSLDAVPPAQRANVERVTLSGDSSVGRVPAAATPSATTSSAATSPSVTGDWRLEPGSFGLGFGAALLLSLLFRLLPNGWRSLTRVAVVLGIGALLAGLYLGAIRRATEQGSDSALASPSALIQDARSAVEKMNQRQRQQEEELRKLQAEGR